jgi:Arc/MetJ family transcription regulator
MPKLSLKVQDFVCVQLIKNIHRGTIMRTNIIIDDELMTDVLKLTGIKSKREAVELGLRTLLALKQQEKIKQFKGALKWEGDIRNAS